MQLRSKWKIRIISAVMVLCMIVVGVQPISVFAENTEEVSLFDADVEENLDFDEDENIDEDYYDDSAEDEDEIEEEDVITSIDDMIDVSFNVTSKWDNHYNADVEITNISGEAIDDWELEFEFKDKIENIWNAAITSKEDNTYVIRNADWNQDIPVDGKVSFGMTVEYFGEIEFPQEILLTKECMIVEGKYSVEYKESNRWDNHVCGQIVISNNTDHRIEDWKLDLNSNLDIENIWNAKIVSKYENIYRLDNVQYNQNIEVGQSVEFGFIAKVDGQVIIEDYVLNEMSATEIDDEDLFEEVDDSSVDENFDDEVESDETEEDEITYPKDFVFEPDDFEFYEDYLDHIQGNASVKMAAQLFSIPQKPKYNVKDVKYRHRIMYVDKKGKKSEDITKSIQNYCIGEDSSLFTIQGRKGMTKHVALRKGKYDEKTKTINVSKSYYTLNNFAHGQTFEQFTIVKGSGDKQKKVSPFILEGNAATMWGTQLMFVDYSTIKNKASSKNNFTFKKKYGKRLTGLAYANKSKKAQRFSKNSLKRVHAALSSDKKHLAIWCQDAKNEKIQLSVYNFTEIKNYLYGNKKHRSFSFEKNHAKANEWCEFSYIGNTGDIGALKPGGSFQSMDLSNLSKDKEKFYLYICGGNEAKEAKEGLQIARVTLNKKDKKISNPKRFIVNPKVKVDGKEKALGGCREIEGCHINKSKLDFLITKVPAKKNKKFLKNPQYVYTIKKSVFK